MVNKLHIYVPPKSPIGEDEAEISADSCRRFRSVSEVNADEPCKEQNYFFDKLKQNIKYIPTGRLAHPTVSKQTSIQKYNYERNSLLHCALQKTHVLVDISSIIR